MRGESALTDKGNDQVPDNRRPKERNREEGEQIRR